MDELSGARRRRRLMAVAAFAMLLPAGSASHAMPMETGELTSQPIGHYEFCQRLPAECSIRPRDKGPERMSQRLWNAVSAVNVSVNRSVRPMNDRDIYGQDEYWAYPSNGVGDCEDYVLEKRRLLSRQGISLANLLITVVRKPDGEGHAVLTVRTSEGDYILDNLNDTVKPWTETGYRYLKRQASSHTGRWVSLKSGDSMLVGSTK